MVFLRDACAGDADLRREVESLLALQTHKLRRILFGAAPSVALATLALAISKNGKTFAATECRSMMAGAAGLCLYSILVSQLLSRFRLSALTATLSATLLWFLTAFGLWRIFLN